MAALLRSLPDILSDVEADLFAYRSVRLPFVTDFSRLYPVDRIFSDFATIGGTPSVAVTHVEEELKWTVSACFECQSSGRVERNHASGCFLSAALQTLK
jgi:hypothetical protein